MVPTFALVAWLGFLTCGPETLLASVERSDPTSTLSRSGGILRPNDDTATGGLKSARYFYMFYSQQAVFYRFYSQEVIFFTGFIVRKLFFYRFYSQKNVCFFCFEVKVFLQAT